MIVAEPFLEELLIHGAGTLVRATALLLGALNLALLLRRSSAAARHALWTVVVAGLLALPVLSIVSPRVPVPLLPGIGEPAQPPPPQTTGVEGGGLPSAFPPARWPTAIQGQGTTPVPSGSEAETVAARSALEDVTPGAGRETGGGSASGFRIGLALAAVWLLGFGVLLSCLSTGLVRSRRLMRGAREPGDPEWKRALEDARRELGIRQPVSLRLIPGLRTPLSGGLFRGVILLPEEARRWSAERRELVLLHELVHLRRRDPLRLVLGRLALALYWFHPLVWLGLRGATLAREEACDEAVVALGHRPSSYAGHLLALAGSDPAPAPAFSRFDRPPLERRITTVLRFRPRRRRGLSATVAVAGIAWALLVSGATPAEREGEAGTPAGVPGGMASTAPFPTATSLSSERTSARFSEAMSSEAETDSVRGEVRGPVPGVVLAGDTLPAAPDPSAGCVPRDDGPDFGDGAPGVLHVWGPGNRFYQRSLGELMLCMRTRGAVEFEDDRGGIRSMDEGAWVVLSVRGEGVLQRMEIGAGPDERTHRWFVDGTERPFDAPAREWRDAMLAVMGWRPAAANLRAREMHLRAELALARRSEEISLGGVLTRLRSGKIGSRGVITDLRGEGILAQSELTRLQRRLSVLDSARELTEDPVTRARLAEEVEDVSALVRAAEKELRELEPQVEARIAEVERQLARRQAAAQRKMAEAEETLAALEATRGVEILHRRLETLDADGRIRELESRAAAAERRLLELIRRWR